MLAYEVNLEINPEIYEAFKNWLSPHVKEILKLKGFIQAMIFEEQETQDKLKKIKCLYYLDSQENLNNYLTHHAPQMRQEGLTKFGTQFKATRKIYSILDQCQKP